MKNYSNELLEVALIEDKPEVVDLLIGYDADLSEFLDSQKLKSLYKNQIV